MSSISGVYSPLPQSISDSDSERELHMDSICQANTILKNSEQFDKIYRQNGRSLAYRHSQQVRKIRTRMSMLRKTAFIISIIMCFLPIIVLLWVLPCDSNTCPIKIANWESRQEELELIGQISLVHGNMKSNLNLAVPYRGNVNSTESLKHGVISFTGSNGGVLWYFRQDTIPIHLDCELHDVDGNGIPDCLLLDQKGLKSVEAVTGQIIWHAHSHGETSLLSNIDFPIKLADFNNDGVNELLSIYKRKYLLLICGRTGQALTSILVNQCNDLQNLLLVDNNIQCNCRNDSELSYFEVPIADLKKTYLDENFALSIGFVSRNPVNLNVSMIGNHKLTINNSGTCPACNAKVELLNTSNNTLRSWFYNNSYVFKATCFSFNSSKSDINSLKGHINGFVFKIWQWEHNATKKKVNGDTNGNVTHKRYTVNLITEHVVLLTFNNTNYHVINASLTEVTQLCFHTQHDILKCQPELRNQDYSLLIADLDHDGSHELISFSSSFYSRDDIKFWQLISTIKVIKLEAELPKLYDTKQTFGVLPNY